MCAKKEKNLRDLKEIFIIIADDNNAVRYQSMSRKGLILEYYEVATKEAK